MGKKTESRGGGFWLERSGGRATGSWRQFPEKRVTVVGEDEADAWAPGCQ
jgi:hypothetical protein